MERTLSSERIYEGSVVSLRVDTVELPDGRIAQREIVEHRGAVVMIPIDAEGQVLLVRQYRKAVEATLLELPAGTLEPREHPEECVRRELQEEIGYLPKQVEKLAEFYASPGFCTELMYLFLATDLIPSRLAGDEGDIEVVRVPVTQIAQLINSGQIRDAKSLVGLLILLTSRAAQFRS